MVRMRVLRPGAPILAQVRSWPSCSALLLGVGFSLLGHHVVADPAELVRFEIPAQPITNALDAYSAVTGLEVFYDGALATGRRSNSVRGVLAPDVALRELLAGTGLAARATRKGSFTLVSAAPARVAKTAFQSYFAAIQAKVAQTLCARAETRPGDVDVVLRIWIASSGTVQQARTVDVSDVGAKDETLAAALRGLPIGEPPTGMPQPVTMAILGRDAGTPSGCADPAVGSR